MPQQSIPDTSNKKAVLVLRLVALFWLLAKCMSWKVWIKERQFPLVPILEIFNWPSMMQYGLFVLSMALLLAISIRPLNKVFIAALLCCELLSCMADQMRWQPWEYQYVFILIIYLINFNDHKKAITATAFVMLAMYLYSGIGKFNSGYLVLVWENIFLKQLFGLNLEHTQQGILYYGGYVTVLFELLFAAGLFFSKTRKPAAWGMVCMHLIILVAIGPLGINYNSIVWPWNILMILLLYIIFTDRNTPLDFRWLLYRWNKLVLLCWGILPALNYIGLWDYYLSSRLYSGDLPVMAFCIQDATEISELENYASRSDYYTLCGGERLVYLQSWAIGELNVQPYPELRVYKQIERKWQETHPASTTRYLYFTIMGRTATRPIK